MPGQVSRKPIDPDFRLSPEVTRPTLENHTLLLAQWHCFFRDHLIAARTRIKPGSLIFQFSSYEFTQLQILLTPTPSFFNFDCKQRTYANRPLDRPCTELARSLHRARTAPAPPLGRPCAVQSGRGSLTLKTQNATVSPLRQKTFMDSRACYELCRRHFSPRQSNSPDMPVTKAIIAKSHYQNQDLSCARQLRRINPPQVSFAVVRNPDRAKSITDRVGFWIISILVNHLVPRRINTHHRRSTHRHPDQPAAITNLAASAGDMRGNHSFNFVGAQINARHAAL